MNEQILYSESLRKFESVVPNLFGPTVVQSGSTNVYTITYYSPLITYSVSTTQGSISIENDTITYIAPEVAEDTEATFTVYKSGVPYTFSIAVTKYEPAGLPQFLYQVIKPLDNITYSLLNYSISMYGDNIIVGIPGANVNSEQEVGRAYIFTYNSTSSMWERTAILDPSDGVGGDNFGYSVSIYGDVAIVGAAGADSGAGKAYIFRYNGSTWVEEAILTASDKASGDAFGCSVSIYGDVAIVGAYTADPGGVTDAGKAYIFRYNGSTWVEEAILTASDKATYDRFGNPVSIYENVAIVGAYDADPGGLSSAGKAYIFRYNGSNWVEEAILTASDKAADDWFGYSVSIYGNVAIVGAYGADPGGVTDAGKAYIFRYNGSTWVEEKILSASDKATYDAFGYCVSIYGNVSIVGAKNASPGEVSSAGKAYIFK